MEVLITAEEIRRTVSRLAGEINEHYGERPLLLLGVANGCIVFMSDLIRQLRMPLRLELVRARSYHGTATRPGELLIDFDQVAQSRISGSEVLLVDDIFDTGYTLTAIVGRLQEYGADDVRTAVLLSKPARCEVDYRPDFLGTEILDRFVVGYGLDHDGLFRNLPYIAVVDDSHSGDLAYTETV